MQLGVLPFHELHHRKWDSNAFILKVDIQSSDVNKVLVEIG